MAQITITITETELGETGPALEALAQMAMELSAETGPDPASLDQHRKAAKAWAWLATTAEAAPSGTLSLPFLIQLIAEATRPNRPLHDKIRPQT